MSCDKWAYDPKVCDGYPCPGDCDLCSLPNEMGDEEEEQEIKAQRKGFE